jgi:hypothetical protein
MLDENVGVVFGLLGDSKKGTFSTGQVEMSLSRY